jgi:hypothetical protein
MFYVFLCIKLFVNISLFIVQHDLNKIQINSTKKLFFLTKLRFPIKKHRDSVRMRQNLVGKSGFWFFLNLKT